VLQQAATLRKADSVNLLACSGADQVTLDEGLKAALAAKDQACIQELLRHGADINKFPNALANAIQSNDQNFVRLLLRAPKALRPEIISSCLPAAVRHNSEPIASLLISYGADPNFDSASALNMAIGKEDWTMALTLVAGPIRLAPQNLQRLLDTVMRLRTCTATLQFLQLLFCCGLPPASIGLPDLLICRVRKNDTAGSSMMINHGVPTTTNEAECLRLAIANSNWVLVDAILDTPIEPQHASAAVATLPLDAPQSDKLRVVQALVRKGASGRPLGRWLNLAIEESDVSLLELLLDAGAPVDARDHNPLQLAIAKKNVRCLQILLAARPSPDTLARAFSALRSDNQYSASDRLNVSRLLLDSGAQGTDVDQALIDAVKQGDESTLRLLCSYTPTPASTSAALPFVFDSRGLRHPRTVAILDTLLSYGVEDTPALLALRTAIGGGLENLDIVQRLLDANPNFLGPALEYTIALDDVSKKAPLMEALLKLGIPREALDKALTTETQHAAANKDLSTTTMLVRQGASWGAPTLSI
jgi:ankyrin repeat protein